VLARTQIAQKHTETTKVARNAPSCTPSCHSRQLQFSSLVQLAVIQTGGEAVFVCFCIKALKKKKLTLLSIVIFLLLFATTPPPRPFSPHHCLCRFQRFNVPYQLTGSIERDVPF